MKRRRWWRRRGLPRMLKARRHLEMHEARVILRDIEQVTRDQRLEYVMPSDLDRHFPDRYNMRYLPTRMKAMVSMKLLTSRPVNRSGWRVGRGYKLTELQFREDGGGEHGEQDSPDDPG